MSLERDHNGWLQRGKQRAAVAQVLRKPMTATEIRVAAGAINPHIQLRDVWHLLNEMQQYKLVQCRNPRLVTGRLYELAAAGREAVAETFGITVQPAPKHIDWRKYSWVVRAKIRRLALTVLGELENKLDKPQTATSIRKYLCEQHPVGLNPVLRGLKELVRLGLVREAGVTSQRGCRLYRLTTAGRQILEQLKC